jgi:L-2-hydroxyglutarate oxidase LhgO
MEIKQKVLREMEEARQRQFLERESRLAEQAKQERDEFLRIIHKQKEVEEQERRIEEEKKEVLKKHSYQLRSQIQTNDEKTKQDRLDYLEEGRKIRHKIDEERTKIEAIK